MKRCRQTLQAKRKKKKKINCIKFVFIRKDITTKIFAFDSDIDLIIGNAFIRVKFVEIIQNRDGKNWPTLLNFDNGEKFIQEDYLFIKGYRICIRIYFIIYLDIKLIDRTKYKNHRLSVLNFENDKKKKEKFVQRDCAIIYPRRYSIFVLDTRVIFILQFYPDKIYPKKKIESRD